MKEFLAGDEPVDTLEIRAECARGGSGAPVLSASGKVVGMMSNKKPKSQPRTDK